MEITFDNLATYLEETDNMMTHLNSPIIKTEVVIRLKLSIKFCLNQLAHSYSIPPSDNLVDLFESIKVKHPKPTNPQEFTKADQNLKMLSEIVPVDFIDHKKTRPNEPILSISDDDIVSLNETTHYLSYIASRREDDVKGILRPGV